MLPPGAHQDGVQQPPSHEQTGGGGIGQAPQGTHHEPADGGPDFTSPPVMPTAESLDDQLKELQRMQETQMKSLGHSVSVPAAAEVALPPPVSPAAEMQVPNVQSAQGVVINQPQRFNRSLYNLFHKRNQLIQHCKQTLQHYSIFKTQLKCNSLHPNLV